MARVTFAIIQIIKFSPDMGFLVELQRGDQTVTIYVADYLVIWKSIMYQTRILISDVSSRAPRKILVASWMSVESKEWYWWFMINCSRDLCVVLFSVMKNHHTLVTSEPIKFFFQLTQAVVQQRNEWYFWNSFPSALLACLKGNIPFHKANIEARVAFRHQYV